MYIEQLYTGCLAEAAYYIESDGEAVIIDPLRETEPYLKMANQRGAKIKYVLETHFHADFVSGHVDLANVTKAKIVFGPTARPAYYSHIATDGEILEVGKIKIKVLHTPGHTMESTTYLLLDENGKEHAIFTGDTLFIGDVGRPDLAIKTNLTVEDLAAHLYDSLRNKIMTLPDSVIVYPAHGAGSACGKNMSAETFDTLGNQKKVNYALQPMSKEQFIKEVTDGLAMAPQYFASNAMLNINGYSSIDDVMSKGLTALSPQEFKSYIKDALILDVRAPEEFYKGFVKDSINIGLDGQFAPWVGALIAPISQPILLVAPKGREEEAVARLARVGYDNVLGFLDGGMDSWIEEKENIESISAQQFKELYNDKLSVLDVRKRPEYQSQNLIGATNISLVDLESELVNLDKSQTYYIHCAGGYRSMIAASIMHNKGFKLVDIQGGFEAIEAAVMDVSNYVCPSTLI